MEQVQELFWDGEGEFSDFVEPPLLHKLLTTDLGHSEYTKDEDLQEGARRCFPKEQVLRSGLVCPLPSKKDTAYWDKVPEDIREKA